MPLNTIPIYPGPATHPVLKYSDLPAEIRNTFTNSLSQIDTTNGLEVANSTLDVIQAHLPIEQHDGLVSDPLTSLGLKEHPSNCRSRTKVIQALWTQLPEFDRRVKVSKLGKTASHVSSMLIDHGNDMIIELDPNWYSAGLGVTKFEPHESDRAYHMLYPEDGASPISVEYKSASAEIPRTVAHELFTEDEVLGGEHHLRTGRAVTSLVVSGDFAERAMGEKGFSKLLIEYHEAIVADEPGTSHGSISSQATLEPDMVLL